MEGLAACAFGLLLGWFCFGFGRLVCLGSVVSGFDWCFWCFVVWFCGCFGVALPSQHRSFVLASSIWALNLSATRNQTISIFEICWRPKSPNGLPIIAAAVLPKFPNLPLFVLSLVGAVKKYLMTVWNCWCWGQCWSRVVFIFVVWYRLWSVALRGGSCLVLQAGNYIVNIFLNSGFVTKEIPCARWQNSISRVDGNQTSLWTIYCIYSHCCHALTDLCLGKCRFWIILPRIIIFFK